MKTISSAEYQENFGNITTEDISRIREVGFEKEADYLEVRKLRSQVLKEVEEAANIKLDVAKDLDPNVIAYATPENQNGISEAALDNKETALHAAHHEAGHQKTGIFELDIKNISPKDQKTLCAALEIDKLEATAVIEGFNEWQTFKDHGYYENSGYARKEVPLAQEIEKLAQEKLKVSVLEIFNSGDKEKFITTLQCLATHLQLEKTLGFSLDQLPANNNSSSPVRTFQPLAMAA